MDKTGGWNEEGLKEDGAAPKNREYWKAQDLETEQLVDIGSFLVDLHQCRSWQRPKEHG